METVLRTSINDDEIQLSPDQTLTTMVEQWVKSRVETPVQVVSKLDDVARQLLILSGLLQGAFVAIIKLESETLRDSKYAIPAMIALVATALFAMLALCIQSGYLETHPLYKSLRVNASRNGVYATVDAAMERWCVSIGKVLYFKRVSLGLAMISLITSMALTVVCTKHAIEHPSSPARVIQSG